MLKTSLAALLVTLALEAGPVSGLYTRKSPVLQVDASNYDRLIARSNHASIVEFYAPWCGHCKNLKPAYEKTAKNLEGLANVAAIDCDEDTNKALCGQMGVSGFPTLKIVVPSKKPGKPMVEDYQGPRTAKAMGEALTARIPNHVKRVTDKNVDEWLSNGNETAKAILFTEKGTTSATLKALSIDFLGSITIGQIRNKEKAAVETFGISSFPALLLLPGGEKDAILYDGELKKKPMMEFLSQIAKPGSAQASEKPQEQKKKKAQKSTKSSATSTKSADGTTETEASKDSTDTPKNESSERKAPPLRPLASRTDLKTTCLSDTTGTCLLALIPLPGSPTDLPPPATLEMVAALGELSHKYTLGGASIFPFYIVPEVSEEIINLKKLLDIPSEGEMRVIVLNGRRGWWKSYNPEERGGYSRTDLEAWVDAVRMGEMEKKKIPEGALIVDKQEKPVEPEEVLEKEDAAKVETETAPEPEPEQEPVVEASEDSKQPEHEEL